MEIRCGKADHGEKVGANNPDLLGCRPPEDSRGGDDTSMQIQKGARAWELSPRTNVRKGLACAQFVIIYETVARPTTDRQVRRMENFMTRIWRYAARITRTKLAASGRTMQDLRTELEVQGMRQMVDERALRHIAHVWRTPKEMWAQQVMMGCLMEVAESDFYRERAGVGGHRERGHHECQSKRSSRMGANFVKKWGDADRRRQITN